MERPSSGEKGLLRKAVEFQEKRGWRNPPQEKKVLEKLSQAEKGDGKLLPVRKRGWRNPLQEKKGLERPSSGEKGDGETLPRKAAEFQEIKKG